MKNILTKVLHLLKCHVYVRNVYVHECVWCLCRWTEKWVDDTDAWSCFFSGKSVKSLWTSCPRTAPRSVPVDPPPAWSRASREASPTSACLPTASVHPPSARRSPPFRATWWRQSNCWTKERVEGRATTTRRWSTANRGRGTRVDECMDGWMRGRRKREKREKRLDWRPLHLYLCPQDTNWDFYLLETSIAPPLSLRRRGLWWYLYCNVCPQPPRSKWRMDLSSQ